MDIETMLAMQDREVRGLALIELRRLRVLFEESRRRLKRELRDWEGRGEAALFSAAQRREALLRVERVLAVTEERLGVRLLEGAETAREVAGRHLMGQVEAARELTGDLGRLDLGGVGRVSRELLADRSKGFAEKWGQRALRRTKDILAEGVARKASLGELVNDLTGAGGPLEGDRYAAQRLLRTELNHHYNQRTLEGLRETATAAAGAGRPVPKKRLVHVVDDRTAADSLAIMGWPDNVVKDLDEDFWDPVAGRGFSAPPNRPNDRARLVAYFGTEREDRAIGREREAAVKEEERRMKDEGGRTRLRRGFGGQVKDESGSAKGGWSIRSDRGGERASVVASAGTGAQKRTLATFEKVIRDKGNEVGAVVRANGGIVRPAIGDEHSVTLDVPRDETGLITVHNHPRGGSFSLTDFRETQGFGNQVLEMRVVGLLPDRRSVTYVARLGGKKIDTLAFLEMEYDPRVRNVDRLPESERYHVRNTVLSEIVGFYYERFIED